MLRSSIGKKVVVAVTGLLLIVFLIGHMAGNLLVFGGRDVFNGYAEKLQSMGPLLWAARLGLLALVALHIAFTVSLTLANRAARPVRYAVVVPRRSTWASRTMIASGLVVLAFIVFHLLHFTVRAVDTEYAEMHQALPDGHHRHDTYAMVQKAFGNEWFVLIYVLAMALLVSHLAHGIKSLLHTLGLTNDRLGPVWAKLAPAAALLLCLGFAAAPVGVYLGLAGKAPATTSPAAKEVSAR